MKPGDGAQPSGAWGKYKILLIAAVSLFLTFGAKITATVSIFVLSHFYGQSVQADAYFIANAIPGLLWGVIFSSIGVAVLPELIRTRHSDPYQAGNFLSDTIKVYVLLGALTSVVCVAFSRQIVNWASPNLPAVTADLASQLCSIMALGFAFSGYVAIQNAIQQARQSYLLPLAAPMLCNTIALIAIVVSAYRHDVRIAAIGAVGAWIVLAPLYRLTTLKDYPTAFRRPFPTGLLIRFARLSAPIMLATFLDQVSIFVGLFIAGGLGAGMVANYGYSSRLIVFTSSVFTTLVSYFLFPWLARAAAARDDAALIGPVWAGILVISVLTLPIAFLSVLLSRPIIQLLYGHGASNVDDLVQIAVLFAILSVVTPIMALREFLNRVLFSYQKNMVPLYVGILATLVNFGATLLLVRWIGYTGLGLGACLGALAYFAGQIGFIFVWKPVLRHRPAMVLLALIIAAATASCGVCLYLFPVLPVGSFGLIAALAADCLAYAAIYAALLLVGCLALRINPRQLPRHIGISADNAASSG